VGPPDVSIILPCYNEAQRIGPSLKRLDAFLQTLPESYEILCVNDGSRDNTAQVITDLVPQIRGLQLIDAPENRGKGAVVKRGMLAAQGARTLFTDADLATPPEEIPRMLEALKTSPVVVGTRIHPDGRDMRTDAQPPYRRFLGKVFTFLASVLVIQGFPDTQCGFKGFQREAAQAIFSRVETEGIVFDVEVLALARALGYAILQLPIQWSEPGGSTMRVRASKVQEVVRALLAIRRRVKTLAQQHAPKS
jgi:dolichyl-phosphate beta-glucosyltransferase